MSQAPAPHPLPPEDFHTRRLALVRLPPGVRWFRFHAREHGPLFFGRTRLNRFDDPEGGYGVLYVARQLEGAFIERFLRDPGPYQHLLTESQLEAALLSGLRAARSLRLVDLAGRGLARMGVDGQLATGDYAIAQRWSSAFYHHPDRPDGLQYRSRHNPGLLCAALFDRLKNALTCETYGTLREHLGEPAFFRLLDRYGVGLIPS
jgi:hypothetical protein